MILILLGSNALQFQRDWFWAAGKKGKALFWTRNGAPLHHVPVTEFQCPFEDALQKGFEAASTKGIAITLVKRGRKCEHQGTSTHTHTHTHTQMILEGEVIRRTEFHLEFLEAKAKEEIGLEPSSWKEEAGSFFSNKRIFPWIYSKRHPSSRASLRGCRRVQTCKISTPSSPRLRSVSQMASDHVLEL